METYNTTERTGPGSRTARFVIAVLSLLVVSFAFLWGRTLTGKSAGTDNKKPNVSEEHRVLANSMFLHNQFNKLQQLDEQALNIDNSIEPAQRDVINNTILNAESALKKSIDSIEKETSTINSWANVVMIDSVTSTFKRALNNRYMMENFREAVNTQSQTLPDEQKQMLQLQYEVQQKDAQIAQLQRELSSNPPVAARSQVSREPERKNGTAESELKEEELRNAGLLDVINGLKADNAKAQDELKKIRGSVAYNQSAYTSATNKVSALQEQVARLSSDLNFEKINCSLIRADANKIISTPKQRKELLSEALQSLQELSLSDNMLIQQKAKEKIRELNAIASAVRD